MKALVIFSILILIQGVAEAKSVYKVTCESLENCPEPVVGINTDGKSVCTGVLVSDDIVATNLHCIPEDIRQNEASCDGRLTVTFPASRNREEAYGDCERIKAVSPPLKDTPLTPDWAFFKLKSRAPRMHAPISTEGFSDSEMITIYKIDPTEQGTGILKKISCPAIQNSLANPFFTGVKSPVVSLVPCASIKGNSGSPLMNSNLEVKGVLNSSGTATDVNLKRAPFSHVSFGSNFACLNIPGLAVASSPSPECGKAVDAASIRTASANLISRFTDPLMKSFNADVNKEMDKIHAQSKFVVLWDVDQKNRAFDGVQTKVSEVTYKPSCINFKKGPMRTKQGKLQTGTVTYNLDYLEWGLEIHLDNSGRPRAELVPKKTQSTLQFSPAHLTQGQPVAFKHAGQSYTLPFCEDIKQVTAK
ncbi:trypsin-like serine peptidase [Bdellovibrio sp. HCB209]|uniref:trypsin-like serine peptidase n=1 Tax=Bdellovibrio sp. HCB209 TaxID=3394354 RepID=UPI0039B586EF